MYRKLWVNDQRKHLICIDSYENGVPVGRFYDAEYDCIPFQSLSQFLIAMDQLLDEKSEPQAFTQHRSFSGSVAAPMPEGDRGAKRGKLASFDIRVLFRQNSSWQGSLYWKERNQEQSFRSVMELVVLLDSALQS